MAHSGYHVYQRDGGESAEDPPVLLARAPEVMNLAPQQDWEGLEIEARAREVSLYVVVDLAVGSLNVVWVSGATVGTADIAAPPCGEGTNAA